MSSNEDDHFYTIGPAVKSTPERYRARFHSVSQTLYCARTASEVKVTPDDYNKFASVNPADSEKLSRMHNASRLTGLGTAVGFFGGALQIFRWTRSPPLLVTGTVITTLAGHLVADDIGSWIYGTYKFDIAGTNKRFLDWVVEERKASAQAAQA